MRGDPLSLREVEVLERIAQGKSTVKIGMELSLSPSTVRVHAYRAKQKMGVPSLPAAVAKAKDTGFTRLSRSATNRPGPKLIRERDDDNS